MSYIPLESISVLKEVHFKCTDLVTDRMLLTKACLLEGTYLKYLH